MKVVCALDSFKGSLSSYEAGLHVKKGITSLIPDCDVTIHEIADGGEGTMEVLTRGMKGKLYTTSVTGPTGSPVTASYGIATRNEITTGIIDIAQVVGLPLVPLDARNPMYTSTFGIGELILHIITHHSCFRFIVGIGGSSTNDAGVGMLQALGYSFLDEAGKEVSGGGIGVGSIHSISFTNVHPLLNKCFFTIACDVNNPLFGPEGCSVVYGPQKGASTEDVQTMDSYISSFATLTQSVLPTSDPNNPGSGAAGGLGFAFREYLGGTLEGGVSIVLRETLFDTVVSDCDVLVVGEGRLDFQTTMGKAPIGVATRGKELGVKMVIGICGSVGEGAEACNAAGIDAYFPILQTPGSLSDALQDAAQNLEKTTVQIFNLLKFALPC